MNKHKVKLRFKGGYFVSLSRFALKTNLITAYLSEELKILVYKWILQYFQYLHYSVFSCCDNFLGARGAEEFICGFKFEQYWSQFLEEVQILVCRIGTSE